MTNTENSTEKAVSNGGAASAVTTVESSIEIDELPKAIVRRLVKDKLTQLSPAGSDLSVQKDALTAFSESARIFIHYLSATANDICKDAKRQTVNAEDVFKALEEMEYFEFVAPLRAALQELRKNNAGKKSGSLKANEPKDKGKEKESLSCDGEDADNGDGEDNASD